MEQQKGRLYEGMYILSAHLSEEARKKAFEAIKDQILSRGGVIKKIHEQGKRRLAYEVNRQRDGYYYLMYFEVNPAHLKEMWEEYRLNENLLRFLTIRTDTVMEELKFKILPEM